MNDCVEVVVNTAIPGTTKSNKLFSGCCSYVLVPGWNQCSYKFAHNSEWVGKYATVPRGESGLAKYNPRWLGLEDGVLSSALQICMCAVQDCKQLSSYVSCFLGQASTMYIYELVGTYLYNRCDMAWIQCENHRLRRKFKPHFYPKDECHYYE